MQRPSLWIKYIFAALVLIGIGATVVQTQTYINVAIKGNFDVSTDSNLPNPNSGDVYLTTLGAKETPDGWEEYTWTHATFNEGDRNKTEVKKLNLTSDEITYNQSIFNTLDEKGWVKIPFSPSSNAQYKGKHFVGFKGNPDAFHYSAILKQQAAGGLRRSGIGAFIIIVPNRGHIINKILIRDLNATEGSFVEFKTDQATNSTCNVNGCILNVDDDFTHKDCLAKGNSDYITRHQGWFGSYDPFSIDDYFCAKNSRTNTEPIRFPPSNMPKNESARLGVEPNRKFMVPVMSLSSDSLFKAYDDNEKGGTTEYINIWNRVWNFLIASNNILEGLVTDEYKLSPTIPRNEQPVVLGLGWQYEGGQVYNDPTLFNKGYFTVSVNTDKFFQVYIEFAQKGFKIKTEAPNHPNATLSLASITSPPHKAVNLNNANLPQGTNVAMRFGGSSQYCIKQIDATRTRNKVTEDGTELEEETESKANILSYPLAVGESVFPYSDYDLHNIEWNYAFSIDTFEPSFRVSSSDSIGGKITIGEYVRLDRLNAFGSAIEFTSKSAAGLNVNVFGPRTQSLWNDKSCNFGTNYLQKLVIEPRIEEYFYFDKFESKDVTLYTTDLFDNPSNPNTLTVYNDTTSANVQFATSHFAVYAQLTGDDSPTVTAHFKRFPTITLGSLTGSPLTNRVTPNREKTLAAEKNAAIPTKNLIFLNNGETYQIEPNRSPETIKSLSLTIDKRLERVYLVYDNNIPIVVYAKDMNAELPDAIPENVEKIQFPTKSDASTHPTAPFSSTLSMDDKNNYILDLPIINANLEVFLDFTPYQLSLTVTPNMMSPPENYVFAKISSDGSDNTIMGTSIAAKANTIITLNVYLQDSHRETHYINDFIEEKFDDEGNSVEPSDSLINPEKRLNIFYTPLRNNYFHFLNNTTTPPHPYTTGRIVANTTLYVSLKEYATIQYRATNTDGSPSPHGRMTLNKSGLSYPTKIFSDQAPPDEIFNTLNTTWTPIKPHTIYKTDNTDANVGFRESDNPTFIISPDPGYYIYKLNVYQEDPDTSTPILTLDNPGNLDENRAITENDAFPGSRYLKFNRVSSNIWIDIQFKPKPTLKTLWMGMEF
jgi:hypothetical protein